MNWIADTLFVLLWQRGGAVHRQRDHRPGARRAGCGPAASTCSARRTTGCNPAFPTGRRREHCNVWSATATSTRTAPTSRHVDICDDWKPLGDPGAERPADGAGVRARPRRRARRGRRARHERHLARCGRRRARAASSFRRTRTPRTRRPCRSSGSTALTAERSAALPDGDLRGPRGREPRVDHLQRLQREDAGHAGARIRDPLRPGTGRRRSRFSTGPGDGFGDIPANSIVVTNGARSTSAPTTARREPRQRDWTQAAGPAGPRRRRPRLRAPSGSCSMPERTGRASGHSGCRSPAGDEPMSGGPPWARPSARSRRLISARRAVDPGAISPKNGLNMPISGP